MAYGALAKLLSFMAALLLAGCGGGGGESQQQAPPDLSGIWSGAWQGTDPSLGQVSGTWVVTINQHASSASGPGTLLGDVDCMDGLMQSNPNTQTAVTGSVTRAPCGTVNWTLTALELGSGSAAGVWTNALTGGSGTMSGTRIAGLTGPRIAFISPPGGKPGAWVTVIGETLSGLAPNGLAFDSTPQSAVQSSDATRIVARVPNLATTGPIHVTTTAGVALSPLLFNLDVGAPPLVLGNAITQGSAPAALAVSPDGRKFYIADRSGNSVSVVRASTLQNLVTRTVVSGSPRGVAASPDGKRIYVAAAGIGIVIMDAATAIELNRVGMTLDDQGRDNPQGIAISPDGRVLAVSSGNVGGVVRLFTVSANSLTFVADRAMASGSIAALGVAFAPDGSQLYVAAAETAGGPGSLLVLDPLTGNVLDADPVGTMPTAIAVHPNGGLVMVTNKDSDSVSVYNAATGVVERTEPVGDEPTGIAYSPDGERAYVVNKAAHSVTVLDGASGANVTASFATGAGTTTPLAIAVNPSGTTAYVSRLSGSSVVELGGMRTLTVVRGGTGIGSVVSTPAGINCGTSCQSHFPLGATVSLAATPQSGSTFAGWSGAGCSSFVQVNANMTCTATFNSTLPPPSQQQQNSGCFIATAAYGSDMAGEVRTLREFRDQRLLTNAPGRAFVGFYYRYSPPVADAIRGSDAARAAVRAGLRPLVWSIANPGHALWIAWSCGLLGWAWRRRRYPRH